MKILLSHNFYRSGAPSGEDIVFLNEKKMLEARGHEVITYTRYSDEISSYGFLQKVNLVNDTTWSKKSYKDVVDLIREHQPDVAHFHNTFPLISSSAYSACREANVPVVQTLHNYRLICSGALLYRNGGICRECVGASVNRSIFRKCYRNSILATSIVVKMLNSNRKKNVYIENVDRYIAPSKFLAGAVIDGGIPERMITIKPHFVHAPPEVNYEKNDYLIYVGRLSAEKGIQTLVSACKFVPDIKVLILGDGAMKEEVVASAEQHDLNMDFIGFVDQDKVFEYVRKAKALIMPSECYEVFGLSVIESLAVGTPVIASAIGGLDELIQNGINGYKYLPGDARELARLMRMIVTTDIKELEVSARRDFEAKYSEESNIVILEKVYEDILRSKNIKSANLYETE